MKDSTPQMIQPRSFDAAPDSSERPRSSAPSDNNNEGQPSTSFGVINSSTLGRRQLEGQCESISNPHDQFRLSESVACFVEEEISSGFILCDAQQELCGFERIFDAQVDILEHKSIICPDYSAVLHIHTTVVEVQFKKLIKLIDRKTGERTQEHPRFIEQDQAFKRYPQLCRLTLRDGSQMIC